jgi:hypothetical protein
MSYKAWQKAKRRTLVFVQAKQKYNAIHEVNGAKKIKQQNVKISVCV